MVVLAFVHSVGGGWNGGVMPKIGNKMEMKWK